MSLCLAWNAVTSYAWQTCSSHSENSFGYILCWVLGTDWCMWLNGLSLVILAFVFPYQLFVKLSPAFLLYSSHPPPLPEALFSNYTYPPPSQNASLDHIYLYPCLLCLTESCLKTGCFLAHLCVCPASLTCCLACLTPIEYSLNDWVGMGWGH